MRAMTFFFLVVGSIVTGTIPLMTGCTLTAQYRDDPKNWRRLSQTEWVGPYYEKKLAEEENNRRKENVRLQSERLMEEIKRSEAVHLREEERKNRLQARCKEENDSIIPIKHLAIKRKYLTIDELQFAISIIDKFETEHKNHGQSSLDSGTDQCTILAEKAYFLFTDVVNEDLLPFKALFYLSLENENYEEAELIRRNWLSTLSCLKFFFEVMEKKFDYFSSKKGAPKASLSLAQKIKLQLEKLSIIGLTDPTLVRLRKELVTAMHDKKWGDAEKIQNIITARVKELTPPPAPPQPQIQVIEKIVERQQVPQQTVGGQTTVVIQQPSEQRIKVEQIPRYNPTDVGRAISLINRGSGNLTPKEEGALRLMGIIMGR